MDLKLFDDYHFEIADDLKEFADFFATNRPKVFQKDIDLNLDSILTEQELLNRKELNKNLGSPYKLRLYILHKNERVGWFLGMQTDAETFYMINTGVFPSHQNKGIYKRLLPKILELLKEKGFQKVYSRHTATNNQIIIPKLREGFLITNFEVSDTFGVLIHLTYYFNETRRKVIEYRVGHLRPDKELRQALSLNDDNPLSSPCWRENEA